MIKQEPILIYASSLPVIGKSSELIAKLCGHLNYSVYLADSGGRNYMKQGHFKDINVLWQNWQEPTESYPEITSWRNISSINYLCRVGPELFARHLKDGEYKSDHSWHNSST
jgi:hypothetical protein